METRTLSLAASSLISAISPEKSESGPEMTLTVSPISYWARGFARSPGSGEQEAADDQKFVQVFVPT